ncbi:MAG: serine hydrolase domain-containing protein, partial [Thermomicrobiales bacterium]
MQAFDALMDWFSQRMADLAVPGGAIGVAIGDQRFTRAIGVADASTGAAFTTDTRFAIASLTKIFTATAAATLAHDGTLHLNEPVRKHLPDVALADPASTAALTVGDLLCHAGGWADLLEPIPGQDALAWYAAHLADLPQIARPGTRFSYSNSGFMVAGAVIEQSGGFPCEEVIARTVLRPLGLVDTTFPDAHADGDHRAVGHLTAERPWTVIPRDAPRAINPAAGLIATLDDILTFAQAHAEPDGGRLDPGILATMRNPRIAGGALGPFVADEVGLGWMLLRVGGERVLMAQGGDAGMISAMLAVPSRRFAMVAFANSESALLLPNEAMFRGLAAFLGLSLPDPETFHLSRTDMRAASGTFGLPGWL